MRGMTPPRLLSRHDRVIRGQRRTQHGTGSLQGVPRRLGPVALLLDLRQGPIEQTGIPTDVAIDGSGFLAVLDSDGKEAYTRRGDLRVGPDGLLVTGNGYTVLGAGGPVAVPPLAGISIARDGGGTFAAADAELPSRMLRPCSM